MWLPFASVRNSKTLIELVFLHANLKKNLINVTFFFLIAKIVKLNMYILNQPVLHLEGVYSGNRVISDKKNYTTFKPSLNLQKRTC